MNRERRNVSVIEYALAAWGLFNVLVVLWMLYP
jgi:hypothetical protein